VTTIEGHSLFGSAFKSRTYCTLFIPGWLWGLIVALGVLLCGPATLAQTSVTTQHNDISRSGANTNETILTPSNVNTTTFGKLFSVPVDGYVYAQPLYLPGITLGAGTAQPNTVHNVILIATENDTVYAFDADSNSGANANPLWKVSLVSSAHGAGAGETAVPSNDLNTTDIVPVVGITGTPVIDPTSKTIYVVAKSTATGSTFIQRLHALDVTTGQEKFGGPVQLSGSVPGTGNGSSGGVLNWDPMYENNRTSLLLLNGVVYIGFGAHNDQGPWHGWILAYNAATLVQTGAWCPTPNSIGGGIWLGGTGLAADIPSGKPYGRLFTATGNGTFDAVAPNYTNNMDYGDSIVKLDLTNGAPTMVSGGTTVGDDFTPAAQASLNNNDQDQGSGGVVILPDSVGGSGHQLVQVGKSGYVYVLNRENLGGYNPNNTNDNGFTGALVNNMFGAPAYWNGNVYVWSTSDSLMAFGFANGTFTSSNPTSTSSESAAFPSPTPSISANGTANGIVWSIKTDNYNSQGRAVLYAHDATNVSHLLYSSENKVSRDNPGNSVKFVVPTVVNGKVYVGAESQVSVFGLLAGTTQAVTPVITPSSESFNPSVQVSISDSTSGATIFYTTDGSTPTTASAVYTSPFTITATTTVNAIAGGTGFLQSSVATAAYTLSTQTSQPTFTPAPGTYTAIQSVSMSTTTPNATIYYTTDGSTPTTSSSKYTAPITVGATETLSAIAVASGLSNSPVTSGIYTIVLGSVSSINYGSGFTSSGMNLIGSAKLNGTSLELTDGGTNEAAVAWYQVEANVGTFTTDFNFLIAPGTTPTADGFTFTLQGNNATSIGDSGGSLGYGSNTNGALGIGSSVAVKFDLFSNNGEGTDSTGLYTNGAWPATPAVDMSSSPINLHSGDPFHVHMSYDGTILSMTITDSVTNGSFVYSWPIDIPGTVGDTVSYVGFTGGTGGDTAIQSIQSWTFTSTSTAPPTITSLSPTSGLTGSSVTIAGSNFGLSQGSSTVTFNGTAATVTSWSATSITVNVPSSATAGYVVVTASGVASNALYFTVTVPPPAISTLSPNSGFAGTGVTITGSNFGSTQGTSTVKFNGTSATVTNWSATSIGVTVPSGATTGTVVVTVNGVASNGVTFSVTVPSPTITSVSPSSGPTGTAVTITGSNFGATQGSSTVMFNGTAATVTSWSATSIGVTVPSGASTGNVVVTVNGIASNGVSFTVTGGTGGNGSWGSADTWLQMNTSSSGTTLTSTILNAGTVGGSVTWSLSKSPLTGYTVGASQGSLGGTITVGGTPYPANTTTQSLALSHGAAGLYIQTSNTFSGHATVVANGYITFGPPNAGPNGVAFAYVTMTDWNGHYVVLELNNGNANGQGNCYCVRIETDGNGTLYSSNTPVTPGYRYSYSMLFDEVGGMTKLALFDPQNGYAQVGTTMTVAQKTGSILGRWILGNYEWGTASGATSYFEDSMLDWTNHVFPNHP
jgi:hypothetical protein